MFMLGICCNGVCKAVRCIPQCTISEILGLLSRCKHIWFPLRNPGNSCLKLHCGNAVNMPHCDWQQQLLKHHYIKDIHMKLGIPVSTTWVLAGTLSIFCNNYCWVTSKIILFLKGVLLRWAICVQLFKCLLSFRKADICPFSLQTYICNDMYLVININHCKLLSFCNSPS